MKKFMTPEIELVKFAAMDVITTSTDEEEENPEPSLAEFCI